MLLRCYAVVTTLLVATYPAWPFELRQWPFLAVTLGAVMPAVVLALRRAPAGTRAPWWVRIGVSVGADGAAPGDTVDALLRRADLAIYEAKKSKRVGALSLVLAA